MDNIKTALVKIMADLPKRDRLIMSLYYYENLTVVEIGAILKIKEETVKKNMNRVLNILREKM